MISAEEDYISSRVFEHYTYILQIYLKNWMLTINASEWGFQGRLSRLCDSSASYRYRIEGESSKESSRDATLRLPSKLGQRRPLEHPFAGISRLSTRKLQARYTHATETVARGRKEGRKRRRKRTSEREARGARRARCRRRSSCGYAVNHDEVP
jgi:hypothetical protein